MRLYCDMNVYNRCFDDQSQPRIKLETAAIESVFALAEAGKLILAWSFMLDYENSLNPHEDRKEGVRLLSELCRDKISPSPEIVARARRIIKGGGLKPRDAVHLACAEIEGCDYFVTCDDGVISVFQRKTRPKLKVQAINPVDFIRKEGPRYGQG